MAPLLYVLGLHRGRALAWAEALVSNQEITSLTFDSFSRCFQSFFNHPDHLDNASTRLLDLHQGPRSIVDWTLVTDAPWNEEARRGMFTWGLNESVKDKLAAG